MKDASVAVSIHPFKVGLLFAVVLDGQLQIGRRVRNSRGKIQKEGRMDKRKEVKNEFLIDSHSQSVVLQNKKS